MDANGGSLPLMTDEDRWETIWAHHIVASQTNSLLSLYEWMDGYMMVMMSLIEKKKSS